MRCRLRAWTLTLAVGSLLITAMTAQAQTTYYWNGSGAISTKTSWGTNTDGKTAVVQ